MRSPALAFAWEFRQRHRWGVIALAGYVVVVGTIQLLILGPAQPVTLDPPNGSAGVLITPLSATFFYFVAVFTFGVAGDLAARQSIYPARMFTLPVPTAALAGWPMLYGTAAMMGLWLTSALLARWTAGIDVPVIWPALLAAAFLSWTQALAWMPYGLPGLRVISIVLWLVALDAVVIVAIHYEVPEPLMVAFLAPQLPLAYLAACFAVGRARRGDVPDWRGMASSLRRIADVRPRRPAHFPSATRAQLWLEWRRHGRSLPALVGILLPFELALLFLATNDTPALVLYTLLAVLVTPPVMAGFAGAAMGRSNPRGAVGLMPFDAARPFGTAALIAARLKMAIWSTLAAWLLVLVAIPLALTWSGTWPVVMDRAHRLVEAAGAPRATVIVLLGLSGLAASTWKKLVQSLCIELTGREWISKLNGFLGLSFLFVIGPVAEWIVDDRNARTALWNNWHWILAALVCLKMTVAAWIAIRLVRSRPLSDRALVCGAACWCAAVLALYGLLVWLVDTPFVARYLLALLAILAVPLARVSAAPLALAWNRHR